MSQGPSPYSEPRFGDPTPKPGIGLAAVLAICFTLLLMCGGILGFGFFAVQRLAEVIEQEIGELGNYDFEEEETPLALRYALRGVEVLPERVGEIESIEVNDDLTYDRFADSPDYFYDVRGDQGDAVVRVRFSDSAEDWFSRVTLVDATGKTIQELSVREVPFDSGISRRVWDRIETSEELTDRIGNPQRVTADWQATTDAGLDTESTYRMIVRGEQGSANIEARFTDFDYETVESVTLIEDGGGTVALDLTAPSPNVDGDSDPEEASDRDVGDTIEGEKAGVINSRKESETESNRDVDPAAASPGESP